MGDPRPTIAQAEALLYDWRVQPTVAFAAYRRAVRGKFTISHGFTIWMAEACRCVAEYDRALSVWSGEGGADG